MAVEHLQNVSQKSMAKELPHTWALPPPLGKKKGGSQYQTWYIAASGNGI